MLQIVQKSLGIAQPNKEQNAGQNHNAETCNIFWKCGNFELQTYLQEDTERKPNAVNTCYHLVQTLCFQIFYPQI